MKKLRQEFSDTMVEVGINDQELVVMVGDISHGILKPYAESCQGRYFNIGICEPSIVNLACGLSKVGLNPKKISDTYTLNGGHVYFFYDKGKYLAERYQALITEMKGRGFNPDSNRLFPVDIFKDNGLYNDWTPSPHEYKIIRERLDLRISQKPDWYRKTTSSSDL